MSNKFEIFLNQFDERAWLETVSAMLPEIHEVDRAAVQIWFRFYPLALFRYLERAENPDEAIRKFVMQGDFELKNQIDSSHRFLYGHRFWKETKAAIERRAENFKPENADLKTETRAIAKNAAAVTRTNESLTVGIVLVGLMTLAQAGFEAFKAAPGKVFVDAKALKKSAEQIVEERAKDDSQGLLGFLKTVDKKFTVVWDENDPKAKFRIINNEEIASAAAHDQSQNWRAKDERCIEGVIPVECRSASCGTCWVGILGGQEKLSEVQRLERKQMKIFGYNQPDEAKPFLRLACQAKASGNVTIVIPPWNGVFGKKVRGDVEENVLQPATTSAKQNRQIVKEAVKNQLM